MAQVASLPSARPAPRWPARTLLWGWLAVAAPFGVVGAASLWPNRSSGGLACLGEVRLPGPIRYARLGTDPLGDHVAISDGTGAVHQVTLDHGVVGTRQLYAPDPAQRPWATALGFVSTGPDRPLGLLVVPLYEVSVAQGQNRLGVGLRPPRDCPRFVSAGGGHLVRCGSAPLAEEALVVGGPRLAVADGRARSFRVAVTPVWSTALLDGSRLTQRLLGRVLAVGDLSGGGDESILTVDHSVPGAGPAMPLRLYAWQGRRYGLVWQGVTSLPHDNREAAGIEPLAMLADLDGDGHDELVVGDGLTGRLAVWAWQGQG